MIPLGWRLIRCLELGDLAQASSLLERIDAFPFTFEEGLTLAGIVEGEKAWAARVRDCIPPRQSRKKRQANESFTMEQLHELLDESKKLYFLFKEELRILSKELSDLTTWRAKAQEVIHGDVSVSIANVVERLQSFDLLVYGKLQKAKRSSTLEMWPPPKRRKKATKAPTWISPQCLLTKRRRPLKRRRRMAPVLWRLMRRDQTTLQRLR